MTCTPVLAHQPDGQVDATLDIGNRPDSSGPAGAFSIARFELKEQAAGTQLVFDHLGFPQGLAEHVPEGWNSNYWQPSQKYLG